MSEDVYVTQTESPFDTEELFFSRTDRRGVIASGNAVFRRVAKYDWGDLIGAPHKLIRHPDMPRAVFWLLWDTIKRGDPVGAYVKNRARDGSYYWVFAIVTPIEGGYLSVRLKPTSALLEVVEREYAALRARELAEDLPAEQSAKLLLARLVELGSPTYPGFMLRALLEETEARTAATGDTGRFDITGAADIQARTRESAEIAGTVIDKLSQVSGFPINMRIQASKLAGSSALFGAIAENYTRLCRRISDDLKAFMALSDTVSAAVETGLFKLLVARYQDEMVDRFRAEADEEACPVDREKEITLLQTQRDAYVSALSAVLNDLSRQCAQFRKSAIEMQSTVNGLTVTQTLGLIETARLGQTGRTLNAMLNEVTSLQQDATESAKRLAALNEINSTQSATMAARF